MKRLTVINTLILFLGLLPGAAVAGPGFSGITANADSAETVVSNPAGMTRLKEPSGYGNPMVFYTRSKDEVTINSTGQKRPSGDESIFALPGFYYARPVGERWAVGIGLNAAMGLGANLTTIGRDAIY